MGQGGVMVVDDRSCDFLVEGRDQKAAEQKKRTFAFLFFFFSLFYVVLCWCVSNRKKETMSFVLLWKRRTERERRGRS